ncbi:hypothetical protein NDU88_003456 [Pleurodeles waltl]|uniref:Uncharacterized protein n=1 Tax=Pleurodeles waltl TaxID=8319 RepID=A0AAV7RCX2_PLEWA|nr:hypothetical protein NDU88_003456 [Pleurodeles waltl]
MKLLASRGLRARASRCQGEETRRYGYKYIFSRTFACRVKLSEEPLKGSRAKEERKKINRDNKQQLDKTDPQKDITNA